MLYRCEAFDRLPMLGDLCGFGISHFGIDESRGCLIFDRMPP